MWVGAVSLAVVVYFSNLSDAPHVVVDAARAEVAQLFREAGVEIEWRAASGADAGGLTVLRLTLVGEAASTALRTSDAPVLGAAMRTTLGTGVSWVFYRRVVREAERHGVSIAPVLASAMAHEIAHLLQWPEQHTMSGLMRARWSHADFRRAAHGELRFTVEDAARFRESAAPATGCCR